jgi:hypothetical protein
MATVFGFLAGDLRGTVEPEEKKEEKAKSS